MSAPKTMQNTGHANINTCIQFNGLGTDNK